MQQGSSITEKLHDDLNNILFPPEASLDETTSSISPRFGGNVSKSPKAPVQKYWPNFDQIKKNAEDYVYRGTKKKYGSEGTEFTPKPNTFAWRNTP